MSPAAPPERAPMAAPLPCPASAPMAAPAPALPATIATEWLKGRCLLTTLRAGTYSRCEACRYTAGRAPTGVLKLAGSVAAGGSACATVGAGVRTQPATARAASNAIRATVIPDLIMFTSHVIGRRYTKRGCVAGRYEKEQTPRHKDPLKELVVAWW